jgi:hypothetical protein
LAVLLESRVADLSDSCSLQKWRILIRLENLRDMDPMRKPLESLCRRNKSHLVEALPKFIFGGIGLVVAQVVVRIAVVLVDLGDYREFMRVLQIEPTFKPPNPCTAAPPGRARSAQTRTDSSSIS